MEVQEHCRFSEAFELAFDRYDYYLITTGDKFEAFFEVKEQYTETIRTWRKHNASGYSIDSYAEGYIAGMARILVHLQLDEGKNSQRSESEVRGNDII